ncbi:copper amine oxidase N-terminal domain-containing protein [Paenibacillus phoenicis]|uniref:copper amine oxidase N-terminal domain-containing protein n=1 Tax=Paenibacillus phoenicis TaxID=554117 RepID=UPI003D2BEAD6
MGEALLLVLVRNPLLPPHPLKVLPHTLPKVPLREISDLLGATFNYDAKSGVITVSKNSNKVTFTIGSKKVYYNGEAETINVAPMIVKGVTYVPLQSLVKGLEASLKADNSNKLSITIK